MPPVVLPSGGPDLGVAVASSAGFARTVARQRRWLFPRHPCGSPAEGGTGRTV